jgi:hypothetical protein
VYDTARETLETITAATATEDYKLESIDAGELVIRKDFVENAKYWADYDKRKSEEIRIPIPATD